MAALACVVACLHGLSTQKVYTNLHLLVRVLILIDGGYNALEDVGITEVHHSGKHAVRLTRDVPDMKITMENGDGIRIVAVLVLTNHSEFSTGLELVQYCETIRMTKAGQITIQELCFLLLDQHICAVNQGIRAPFGRALLISSAKLINSSPITLD